MSTPDFAGRSLDIQRPPIAEINALAAEARARGEDLVDLGQAVLGLPPPESALERVRQHLAAGGVHGYSPDPGLPEVREAVAAFCRTHKDIADATADQVMLTCGANQAFANAVLTLTRPGDEVITFGPGYFDHDFALRLAGCVNVEVGLALEGDRFRFDVDAVAAAVTPRTRAVVLVSPGNPTGAVVDDASRRRLTALCAEHDLWLLSDETYDLLTFPGATHRSPAADRGWDRVVVLGSFSKVFGLAGWRVGYLLGPAWLVEEAIKAQDTLVVCAPVPAQLAALGALESVDAFSERARQTLLERRDTLLSALEGLPWVTPTVPEGATFTLARISHQLPHARLSPTPLRTSRALGNTARIPCGRGRPQESRLLRDRTIPGESCGLARLEEDMDDVALCRDLVTRAGVVSVPGSAFGPRGAGWVRFSYGNLDPERIREAGRRLAGFDPAG